MIGAVVVALCLGAAPAQQAGADEESIRALVARYFEAQVRKDADTVLSLWSAGAAARPTRPQLTVQFDTGDDQFTVTIPTVTIDGDAARARVSTQRVRTVTRGGATNMFRSESISSMTFAREPDGWKITAERPAAEEVADALLAAAPEERSRMLAEPGNNSASVRQALASRASRLAMMQQYVAAQAAYELVLSAARLAGDRRGESETLHNIANALYFQRELVKAGEYYQQRLALAREMQDDEGIAASMLGLATVAYSRGEYTPAIASYREALAIYERTDSGPSIGSTLIGIGNVQYLQAEYDAAAATYRRALPLLEAASDVGGVALARRGLGRVFAARGDLASALDLYGKVLEDARARRPPTMDVPATLESIGELHYRLGNVDQARAAFDEARRLSDDRQDLATAGRLFADLGLTELIAGKFDAALTAYTSSRARFEKAQLPDGVARAWVGAGFSLSALEKYQDAIDAYRTAIRLLDAEHLDEESARAWLGLSMAQSGAGDAPAALESARRVRRAAEGGLADDLKWRAAVREGEVLRTLARLDEAQRAFEDGIASIQQLLPGAATSADVRGQLEGSANAWAGLAFTFAQRGDAVKAVVAEEQRRAHLRRLFLAPFERDIFRGATASEQDQELQNLRDLISTRAQLRAERSAKRPDAARVRRLREQIDALTTARVTQQAALYARVPELRLWRGLQLPPEAADLDGLLTTLHTLAIEYVVQDEELLILTAAHGETGLDASAVIVPIQRRAFADDLGRALEPASLDDAAEWRKRSAALTKSLIAPIAGRLVDNPRCVFLPDDLLWKVPFEALVSGDRDLASRMVVTYGTSLATLAIQQPSDTASAEPAPRPKLGAIAGPEIAPALSAQLAVTAPGWSPPDAAAAIDSAQRIASLYGPDASVASGAAATEAAARTIAASVDVLHLAVPLQMIGASPLFSSVLLAPSADTSGADGRWELRKWFAERGRARVLVLPDGASFGAAGVGAAMDALAWAAAAAGASTVAVGRWPRDGYATDSLLKAWHERLAQTALTPGDAMRDAIGATRAKGGDAPSAWAGLRVIGGSRR